MNVSRILIVDHPPNVTNYSWDSLPRKSLTYLSFILQSIAKLKHGLEFGL